MAMLFTSTEKDLIKIGEAAFEHYYSVFMGEEVPDEYRITSYKLKDISLLAGDEKEFCVQIESDYSTTGLCFLSANVVLNQRIRAMSVISTSRLQHLECTVYYTFFGELPVFNLAKRGPGSKLNPNRQTLFLNRHKLLSRIYHVRFYRCSGLYHKQSDLSSPFRRCKICSNHNDIYRSW